MVGSRHLKLGFQIFQFSGRSNWGKGGLVAHSAESIDLKLDGCDRESFIGSCN